MAIERLVDVFGRPPHWNDNTAVEYLGALDDLTAAELDFAVHQLRRNHRRFMPTPAEIREAAGYQLDEGPRGWASKCGGCGCDLSYPESRRLGECKTCRGALH